MEPILHNWNGLLWRIPDENSAYAHCPKHKGLTLDVIDGYGQVTSQKTMNEVFSPTTFICPLDDESFELNGDIFTLIRRVNAITRSEIYKNAKIIDLDNMYTPILKVEPKPKDKRYSIQVEIDETPNGKKMVIYAMDREKPDEKTQVFIDPQFDKLSFDGRGDLHPNMIFSKVVAYFKDGKTAKLDDGSGKE